MPDTSKAIVRFCPHCGNEAPQQLRFTHRCYEEEWTDDGERFGLPTVYFVASCQTCDGFLVYADCGDISEVIDFSKAGLVFPQTNLAGSVPKVVARIYEEAFRIKRVAPNAFATGRNPQHAAVAVTSGILELCDRRELAGVLAHELSHVQNRDTLTSTVAATLAGVITHAVQMLFWYGGAFLRGNSDDRDDRGSSGLASLGLLLVAPIAATLLQLAVSRSREYEADATGARLSGDPDALADALAKLERGVQAMPYDRAPATAHLFIVNPLSGGAILSLFSTHPPIEERIRRLRAMRRTRA